jgi:hypothetical protein
VIRLVGLAKKFVVGDELPAIVWAWASSFPSTPGTCGVRTLGMLEKLSRTINKQHDG